MSTTKAALRSKLAGYGEHPPSSWTVLQLKGRLHECKEEEKAGQRKTLESELKALQKAAGKKATLIDFLKGYMDTAPDNMTINQLFNRGQEVITKGYSPTGKEEVSFGKFGGLTFRQVRRQHSGYCECIKKTARESDSPHWRLVRLAQWLEQPEEIDSGLEEELVQDAAPATSSKGATSSKKVPEHLLQELEAAKEKIKQFEEDKDRLETKVQETETPARTIKGRREM